MTWTKIHRVNQFNRTKILFVVVWIFMTVFASELEAQEGLTAKEKSAIRALKVNLDKVAAALKRERTAQAEKIFSEVIEQVNGFHASLSEGMAEEIRDDLERVQQLRKELLDKGATVPELQMPTVISPASISFKNAIAPILLSKCGECHVRANRGAFSMATFADLEKSGKLVPGDPVASEMIRLIDNGEMPKGNLKVTEAELKKLRDWVRAGAKIDVPANEPLTRMNGGADVEGPVKELQLKRATGKESVSFSRDIAPLLVSECKGCHLDSTQVRGNLNLGNFNGLLRGGDSGPLLVPGKSAESLLVKKLNGTATGNRMPLQRDPLSEKQIALVSKWIEEGAVFDGDNPGTPTTVLAAVAKAVGQSHEELSVDRSRLAELNWKRALPNIGCQRVENEEFRILGTISEDRLKKVEAMTLSMVEDIKSNLQFPKGTPLVKGKLTFFLLEKRYDFNELSVMLEGHPQPKDSKSSWKNDRVDVYIAIPIDRSIELELIEPEICRVVTAAAVSDLAPAVPIWFAEGIGFQIAEKTYPKSEAAKNWGLAANEATGKVKNANDLLGGKYSAQITGLAGYRLIAQLKQNEVAFKRLFSDLRRGNEFSNSFKAAYGGEVADVIRQLIEK